jgi:sorbitol-specific phosphotransferase system component IIBC
VWRDRFFAIVVVVAEVVGVVVVVEVVEEALPPEAALPLATPVVVQLGR